MPRRSRVFKRKVTPDPKYSSLLISRFIVKIMFKGKRSTAEKIVYDALDIIQNQTKKDPLQLLEQAIKNITPTLEVKPRRVGGATYQVPVEVKSDRGLSMALKWLIKSSRDKKGKPMAERLASELNDAAQGQGAAIKKREETHKMAEANRAFAHYRW